MNVVTLTLPWPPTINHYYGHTRNGRIYLLPEGKRYRLRVAVILAGAGWPRVSGKVEVRLVLQPPDRRRRDIDNVRKAVYDAISDRPGHRGVIADDADIKTDSAVFAAPDPAGEGLVFTVITDRGDNDN